MAKKRNKKDKIRAKMHQHLGQKAKLAENKDVKISELSARSSNQSGKKIEKPTAVKSYLEDIFAYDPKLIIKDLKKTFLVVLFILLILLTISLLYT